MKVYSRGRVGVHTDYRENIIVDHDHPILKWKANKERFSPSLFPSQVRKDFPEGLPRISSQHSEDALSWNVFRSLQLANNLHPVTDMLAPEMDIETVYFWQHDAHRRSQQIDPEIQHVLNEMEPWGKNGVKQQTETDVILRGKRHLIMVESKLGKPSEIIKAWSRSTLGMRAEYRAFIRKLEGLRVKLFNDSFDYERDGNRFCQLFRNYLLGAALSLKWNAEFSLLAIVNSLNSNLGGRSHEEEFGHFQSLLEQHSNTFLGTWQQIWSKVREEAALEALQKWLVNHPLLGLSLSGKG